MINVAELNKGLIKKIKDQHLFPWLHKPSLYDSLFIQNMILMDTWIEYILWRYSLYHVKISGNINQNTFLTRQLRMSNSSPFVEFFSLYLQKSRYEFYLSCLFYFWSHSQILDIGTTNCTMTRNRGHKFSEIEDKKSKRDMIKY